MQVSNQLPEDQQRLIQRLVNELDHDSRQFFDTLSVHEQSLALDIIRELRDTGDSNLLSKLWEIDFETKPLPIEKFIEDEFYVGKFVKSTLYDRWKQEIAHVINNGYIHEWVLSGGIGIGKTSIAILTLEYYLYKLLCMRDPCAFYGKNSIVFASFSISLNLVGTVVHNILMSRLNESEYFRSVVGVAERDDPRRPTSELLNFPKGIKFAFGSRHLHALGQDIFFGIMDEVAFSTSVESRQVIELYKNIRNRITSRFKDARSGNIPGLLCLISSANYEGDWLDQHIKEVQQEKETVHITSLAIYSVKAKEYENQPRFRVVVGDRLRSSRIIDIVKPLGRGHYEVLKSSEVLADDARVEEVPVIYYEDYVRDIEQALKDISGIALFSTSLLITQREKVYECIDDSRSHPFTLIEPTISIDDEEVTLESIFLNDKVFDLLDPYQKVYKVKVNPGAPRFVAVDIGLVSDSLGLAVCHMSSMQEVKRRDKEGKMHSSLAPIIFYDILLRVKPPRGSEIDLSKIRSFIYFLQERGMPIAAITMDNFQSSDSLQNFKKSGIEAKRLSVDRSPSDPYLSLKTALLEKRVNVYRYPPFIEEITAVQYDKKKRKVDHPPNGSKDVSDAVASAYFSCITSEYVLDRINDAKLLMVNDPQNPVVDDKDVNRKPSWVYGDYDGLDGLVHIDKW